MDFCPVWNPILKDDEGKGKSLILESKKMYDADPDLYGACGVNNPLGQYALWFHKSYIYGLHGNSAEWVLEQEDPNDRACVSGGCVRNPNTKIKKLFHAVLDYYSVATNIS